MKKHGNKPQTTAIFADSAAFKPLTEIEHVHNFVSHCTCMSTLKNYMGAVPPQLYEACVGLFCSIYVPYIIHASMFFPKLSRAWLLIMKRIYRTHSCITEAHVHMSDSYSCPVYMKSHGTVASG